MNTADSRPDPDLPVPPADGGGDRATTRPTMRDVAALARVALKTVSRVVNNVPTVDPELARRVREASDKLGYRPNLAASQLRSGRTDLVGLLLEDVANPFSASIQRAVEDRLSASGLLVLAASLDENPARERDLARRLIDRRVDGLIIAPAADDHRYIVSEQDRGTAVVFVDRPPQPLIADAVVSDHHDGSVRAITHLQAHGRRRIAFLGDDSRISTAAERYRGYAETVATRGRGVDPSLVRRDLRTADAAEAACAELLASADPPDAVFASQNLITMGAVRALHRADRHRQVALVGFDEIPFADVLRPGITVTAQNTVQLGRIAAEQLLCRMAGDKSAPRLITVPTALIQRGSGELPLP